MVLIDLQKAFDTIDHSILLEKMSCLGFAGKTIAWFTSYLTNRSFIVNVGKESSSPGKLSCGVPQGSYLTDKVKIGFEEGLLTGMVLIDLQKAFDTIDHSILLEKMSCLGFAGKTIAWFTSYLTNRSFIVNVGKESSSPGKLSCGVPQGSILGPLLFLLYVNDMPQAVNSELLLYADDTCLIYMEKNIQKIEEQLNSDLTSLCEWFIDNKLSVHFGEEKTKSILFGTKRQLKDQRDLNLKYGDIEKNNTAE